MRRPVVVLCTAVVVLTGCTSDSVLDLEVGDCLQQQDLADGEVRSVPTVDCASSHDAEVYAEHRLTGDEYPGRDQASRLADAACAQAFEDFVGISQEESELTYSYLAPTEDSWQRSEDRSVLCLVLSAHPVVGSLEGAAR